MNRIDSSHWLFSRPIAHRGLWNKTITENSLSAYQNAVDNGYPIEIDVFSSSDGVLYCFHDDNLYRICGVNGLIYNTESALLNCLSINGKGDKIPTLKEVLNLVGGKVPILIEIKNQPDKKIVERLLAELHGCGGEFAVQSFNPLYLITLRKLAPYITCGLLTTRENKYLEGASFINKIVVKNALFVNKIKPDFISISLCSPLLNKLKKYKTIRWTITDKESAEEVIKKGENIIFENFII